MMMSEKRREVLRVVRDEPGKIPIVRTPDLSGHYSFMDNFCHVILFIFMLEGPRLKGHSGLPAILLEKINPLKCVFL